jgi:ATP-dependent helicase/nuclease subunit B
MHHGIQQQLPAYLNVLRHQLDPQKTLGIPILIPAGVFFVNLRGNQPSGDNRQEVLEGQDESLKKAYQHQGLFSLDALRMLDKRDGVMKGDQFPYRITKTGQPYKNCTCIKPHQEFEALLDHQEAQLIEMGQRIFTGEVGIDPWKKGQQSACDHCDYASVCRIDPWSHEYRVLTPPS